MDARSTLGKFLGQEANIPIKPRNQNVGPPPSDSGLDKIIIKKIEGREFTTLDDNFSQQAKGRLYEMIQMMHKLDDGINLSQIEPDVFETITDAL